jgi:hypothetical protein
MMAGADPASMDTTSPAGKIPSFTRKDCASLSTYPQFSDYTADPVTRAGGTLAGPKSLAAENGIGWSAWDDISLYRAGQAQQVMAAATQDAALCANVTTTMTATATPGTRTRTHLVTLHKLGNRALDLQVRVTSDVPGSVPVAFDWILIRSGNYLLDVDEQGNPVQWNKYLTESAQALWTKVHKNG